MNSNSFIEISANQMTPAMVILNILSWVVSFLAILEGSWILAITFFLAGTYTLLFVLYTAQTVITLNNQGVVVNYIFGKYGIEWDEIESITLTLAGLIFEGSGKVLTLPDPSNWSSAKREQTKMQIETLSGVPIMGNNMVKHILSCVPKWHNTKIEGE